MIAGFFEPPAALLAWFYSFTHSYVVAISLIALVVMLITAPLVLKSTKGMLEMQKLQPEMKRLQNQYRGDRQKLNEEMMKLYQEHKVNPLASCFPLLLQMPVFFIMFKVLHGLTNLGPDGRTFAPLYVSKSSEIYTSLAGKSEMISWGLDLAKRPYSVVGESFTKGLLYVGLVVLLGVLYFVQQRMVASRVSVSPTMSATQQKLMQYLPVLFAVFMGLYLTGLVVYYTAQAIIRIGLNQYITHRFYKGEQSLGRQAQAASERARELHKKEGGSGSGGGLFAQAKRDLASAKEQQKPATSKRVTPPKNKPTGQSGRTTARPAPTGKAGRPGSGRPPKKK
jgi:YidC/Oxa1 family membrane protein insertase